MERANHLTRLRERGTVPDDFSIPKPVSSGTGSGSTASTPDLTHNVKKIIEWLLQKQPQLRPNATDLLKSGLIPLKLEDEYMDVALKAVTDRDSPFHARLMDQLFTANANDAVTDFTFDYKASGGGAVTTKHSTPAAAAAAAKNAIPPHLRNLVQMQSTDCDYGVCACVCLCL